MNRYILSTLSGLALLALVPVSAQAHVDVNLDVGVPLYVEPSPQYYAPPPPVYYGPSVIYQDRGWGAVGVGIMAGVAADTTGTITAAEVARLFLE